MSVCINHPDRAGTTRCMTCHKPICNSCVVEIGGKIFCSEVCAENAARFNSRFRPDTGLGIFGQLKGLIVSLVGLAFVIAVLVFAGAKVLKLDFCINLLKKIGL